jgi:hypothetical protein
MLDQDRDEALHAPEDRTVNYHRTMLGVVGPDVLQVEALRHHVIELNRPALPYAAERVRDVEVDLRAIERAVACVNRVRLPGAVEGLLEAGFCVIPGGDLAEELLRTRRELGRIGAKSP